MEDNIVYIIEGTIFETEATRICDDKRWLATTTNPPEKRHSVDDMAETNFVMPRNRHLYVQKQLHFHVHAWGWSFFVSPLAQYDSE